MFNDLSFMGLGQPLKVLGTWVSHWKQEAMHGRTGGALSNAKEEISRMMAHTAPERVLYGY